MNQKHDDKVPKRSRPERRSPGRWDGLLGLPAIQ